MSDETKAIENIVFFYYDKSGKKYCTPNASFAEARAYYYGTDNIFVEVQEN
jgi:hypothetical protein